MSNVRQTAVIHSAAEGCGRPAPQSNILLYPHPAAPGVVASTDGERIFLNPDRHCLSEAQWLHVLGHEFVHMLQQRQGRVRPSGSRRGADYNDDPLLELEADILAPAIAAIFAAGLCPVLPRWNVAAGVPILQHLISIQGRPIRSPIDLPPTAQSLLQLIPEGAPWLASLAAASTQHPFHSDLELVAGIHAGIHGDPLMLLRRLQIVVHPEALAEFTKDEIDSLVLVEQSPGDNSVARMRVRRLLTGQQLLTESELEVGDEFPSQIGLENEPLFRSVPLAGRIALFHLVSEEVTEHALDVRLQTEAADFAIQRSSSIFEFADYYRFFMALLNGRSPDPLQAAKRARFAEATADSLSEGIFDLLWVPNLERTPTPTAMPSIIAQWSERGFRLGFPRLSAALSHIVQHVVMHGTPGGAARQIIQSALSQLQTLWLNHVPGSVHVSQSGLERIYTYDLSSATAQLSLASDGTLSIASYCPRLAQPAAP